MSETNIETTTGGAPDDASTNDPAGTQTNSGPDAGAGGSEQQGASGGKYRERLATAESERDQLRGVVDSLRKQMVETMIDDLKPDAFWAANADGGVDALLTEDGNVDPQKVAAAVDVARKKFGIRPGPRAPYNPDQGRNDLAFMDQGDEFARAFEFNPQGGNP